MDALNMTNSYQNTAQTQKFDAYETVAINNKNLEGQQVQESDSSQIDTAAAKVNISMQSLKVFLNLKSSEVTGENASAQSSLVNIIKNTEVYNFLSGAEIAPDFSLQNIGYEGTAITELTPDEAKELVSDEGFFGVTETSERVSSFVINLAGDNVEALQEARNGVVRGFEEAEQMWGGELPEISYETQEKTLELVDARIAELLEI